MADDAPDLLVKDWETSGLPDFRARSADPKQPRGASLGWLLCRPDGQMLKAWYGTLRPDGSWRLSPQLEKYLNLTNDDLMAYGHDPRVVMQELFNVLAVWPRPILVVGHNIPFDDKITKIEAERAGLREEYDRLLAPRDTFCTMRQSADILNLPPTEKMRAAGFTKPKSPKLEEAYAYFHNGVMPAMTHNALADSFTCLAVFLKIRAHNGGAITTRPPKPPFEEREGQPPASTPRGEATRRSYQEEEAV